MSKPILVIHIPVEKGRNMVEFDRKLFIKSVERSLGNEYHVIMNVKSHITDAEFQVLNDVSGLPDIDIKALIDEYTQKLG